MNAIHTLAGRPARWLALAALAALLALAAALALSAAQPAGAQSPGIANTMETGADTDRSNFRMELSLVDDSDGTVPAGSVVRVRAVFKFDVPKTKTNGEGMTGDTTDAHGHFGSGIALQAGTTLRIAGPYEWENAGGRTLRPDVERLGSGEHDPGTLGADCPDDYDNMFGYVPYSDAALNGAAVGGTAACTGSVPVGEPAAANDWWSVRYSNHGWYGNGPFDLLDDRDGHQGPCSAATVEDTTTWTCEVPLVDEQFGWRGHNDNAGWSGTMPPGAQGDYDTHWSLLPQRRHNAQDGTITIPAGTPDGSFTISGSIWLHSSRGRVPANVALNADVKKLSNSLTVNIGNVAEAASATLDFATQGATTAAQATVGGQAGAPWPSVVAASDARGTRLSLSVLNANGKASAKGSVNAIVLRSNFGRLSGDHCTNNNLTCQIATADLDTSNYGNIPISVLPPAPAKAGVATVEGFLLTAAGSSLPLGPVEITFTGAASTLAISEPTSSILNTVTTGTDNRDQLTLSVSAADASDNRATVSDRSRSAAVKDPDGKTVARAGTASTSGINVVWPLLDADNTPPTPVLDAQRNLQARITVSAAAAAALKTGVYTLEVKAGGLTATREFTVAGEAANIDVAASETDYAPNDRFTLTATVSNADGSAVPDGTPVVWADPQPAARLVRISATTATKDGEATATYVVIGEGRAWITLTSGAGTGFWSETVGAPATPPAAANPADELSARAGFASYLGTADTTASALLGGLGNVTSIRIWQLDRWVLYAVIDGVSPPDAAEDFTVSRGAVLWIGS